MSSPKSRNILTVILCVVLSAAVALGAGAFGAYYVIAHYEPAPEEKEEMTWAYPAVPDLSPADSDTEDGGRSGIYARAVPSIVGVRAQKTRGYTYGLFEKKGTETYWATGTGFFVSADGVIATNYHVVAGASVIRVSTADGEKHDATLLSTDPDHDLALLKTEGVFPPAELGDSSALRVGDDVYVIGNPLGDLTYSFTGGVVSYLGRVIAGESGTQVRVFQTDAAINEGNSGGPVFDDTGKVVGIASAKYASDVIEGLGFCIPIDDVKAVLAQYTGETIQGNEE